MHKAYIQDKRHKYYIVIKFKLAESMKSHNNNFEDGRDFLKSLWRCIESYIAYKLSKGDVIMKSMDHRMPFIAQHELFRPVMGEYGLLSI